MGADETRDVVVVGGGPAGLSCALVLGRARRDVTVCDAGRPRNRSAAAMHGYLTREGTSPLEFLAMGRAELARYPSVQLRRGLVIEATAIGGGFRVAMEDGHTMRCRKLVLATGIVDELPAVPGAEELYGRGLHHCPYCDGWELRDRALLVYGRGDADGAHFALALTRWSDDLTLCTDGPSGCTPDALRRLRRAGIPVVEQRVRRFARAGDQIEALLDDGTALRCGGVFFNTTRRQPGDLLHQLGCEEAEPTGCRIDDPSGRCSVDGLYVIGDASRDALQVIVAAAEGARAAIDINGVLLREDDVLPR